jgi:hypothetical protein
VIAFEFPGVVANAMTGVVIVLGQRVGKGIARSGPGGEWRWTFLLPILYALGAVAVAFSSTSPLTPIFPFIISSIVIVYVLWQVGREKVEVKDDTSYDAEEDNDKRPKGHDQC